MNPRGIQKAVKEVIFSGEFAEVRILFGQNDKMPLGRMDSQHFQSSEKIQEQGMRLDLVARLVGNDKESPIEVQHSVERADRIRIDVVEQEGSLPELCSRQAKNSFGSEAGVSHADKDHIFEARGFNLRGASGHAGEQWF